jgi:hypothetical protein
MEAYWHRDWASKGLEAEIPHGFYDARTLDRV